MNPTLSTPRARASSTNVRHLGVIVGADHEDVSDRRPPATARGDQQLGCLRDARERAGRSAQPIVRLRAGAVERDVDRIDAGGEQRIDPLLFDQVKALVLKFAFSPARLIWASSSRWSRRNEGSPPVMLMPATPSSASSSMMRLNSSVLSSLSPRLR